MKIVASLIAFTIAVFGVCALASAQDADVQCHPVAPPETLQEFPVCTYAVLDEEGYSFSVDASVGDGATSFLAPRRAITLFYRLGDAELVERMAKANGHAVEVVKLHLSATFADQPELR